MANPAGVIPANIHAGRAGGCFVAAALAGSGWSGRDRCLKSGDQVPAFGSQSVQFVRDR